MLKIQQFTFNAYQENTLVLSDHSQECIIIDPGCYNNQEKTQLTNYITQEGLKVVKLVNTHGHIDHMLGNHFVVQTYKVPFVAHKLIEAELKATQQYGSMMGLNPDISPNPDVYIDEGDTISFGNTCLEVYFTPGHAASHISLFHRESKNLFSGDVLFYGSIGRTDLPGGSFEVLMQSIFNKILPLGDDVRVHCGHGPETTIGQEKQQNMFILQYQQGRKM